MALYLCFMPLATCGISLTLPFSFNCMLLLQINLYSSILDCLAIAASQNEKKLLDIETLKPILIWALSNLELMDWQVLNVIFLVLIERQMAKMLECTNCMCLYITTG